MKQYFSIAMLIIGTIIGAGFASGRELVSFFGSNISPLVAFFSTLLIFFLSVVFLHLGTKFKASNISEVNRRLVGKAHIAADIFILVNNFIVLAGMLAGMDSLGNMLFKLSPLYSFLSGALCIFVVCKGIKGLLDCNKIVVPIIIISLVIVTVLFIKGGAPTGEAGVFKAKTFLTLVIYICMNMMLASTVLTTINSLNIKTIICSSAIAALVMGTLILLISLSLKGNNLAGSDMPVLAMAKTISPILFGLIVLVIAISIFTTMLTAMSGLVSWFLNIFHSKIFSAVFVFLAAAALSNLGFTKVVTLLYPVIGVIGLFYIAFGVISASRVSPLAKACHKLFHTRNAHVHKSGKTAQNNGRSHN